MPTVIRHATSADAPALARVMVDTWLAAHRGQVPEGQWQRRRDEWTYADSERSWREFVAEMEDGSNLHDCLYVAVAGANENEDGEVVGLAVGIPSEANLLDNAAEVGAIYILPGYQRQGLGRQLVQAVAAHQARLGKGALLISVLENNGAARRFYEALGGRVVGTRQTEDYGYPEFQVVYGWEKIHALT